MKNKKLTYIFIGFLFFCIAGYIFLTLTMRAHFSGFTPDSSTTTAMYGLKRRILHYAKINNKLPIALEELPELDGFNNRNTDGWGWEIDMNVEGTEVSLISYRKDNKPGGVGANLDLVAIFDAKTSSGVWADENDEGYPSWKQLPKIRWDKSEFE